MKKVKQFLWLCSCIMIAACSNDDTTEPQKLESKDMIALSYEGKQFEFKNISYGRLIDLNKNNEVVGMVATSEIVIDEKHKNRIHFSFRTDFKSYVELDGVEFTPFKENPNNPDNIVGYVYKYADNEYATPFFINNLKIENGRITGTFEGDLHRGIDYTLEPVHLSSGKIDIEAKATND